jgi:hypothetical protein
MQSAMSLVVTGPISCLIDLTVLFLEELQLKAEYSLVRTVLRDMYKAQVERGLERLPAVPVERLGRHHSFTIVRKRRLPISPRSHCIGALAVELVERALVHRLIHQ